MSDFVVEDFTPMQKKSLVGFVTVRTPSGMVFHECSVHKQNDSVWVSPASKAIITKDGTVLKDFRGRICYAPVISFETKYARDKWSAGIVEALRAQRPEVLA
jgi:hypothetical protein